MSQGTLYVKKTCRSMLPQSIVEHYNLDVSIVDADKNEEFEKKFPLKRAPAFSCAAGNLTETMAITYYCKLPPTTHRSMEP